MVFFVSVRVWPRETCGLICILDLKQGYVERRENYLHIKLHVGSYFWFLHVLDKTFNLRVGFICSWLLLIPCKVMCLRGIIYVNLLHRFI